MKNHEYIEATLDLWEMFEAGVRFTSWEIHFLSDIVYSSNPELTPLQKATIIEILEERS